MAYEVEVNHYMGVVVVTLWGTVSVRERGQALDAVLDRLEDGRQYRILVDLIGAYAAQDSYEDSSAFARRLAHERRLRQCRLAYLYPPRARINHVVERLCAARQLRFRKFEVITEALDWLLAPPPRLRPLPPIEQQVGPDAVTLLAGLRSGRCVA